MTAPEGYYEGIGGSLCAAIMGVDKHKSPYDAWLQFTDPSTRVDLSDNEQVRWGTVLEKAIGEEAAKRLGLEVIHAPTLIKHPTIECMQAHIDFGVKNEPALLEVKNRGLHMLKQYELEAADLLDEDRVLPAEALQVHHYLTVTGFDKAYLAVLIGGQKLLTFTINRDPELSLTIETKCQEFWGYVQRREPPPPINVSDVNRLFPAHVAGKKVDADAEIQALIQERQGIKAATKDAASRLEFIDFRIKAFMGDAEELRLGGKKALTWKTQERKEYTVAATTIRVLR